MKTRYSHLAAFGLAMLLATGVSAQEKFKIGIISTMSGPGGTFGQETMAGVNLALKRLNGQLGGVPVEVVSGDDQARPEVGKQLAEKFIQQDKVHLIGGTVFGQVILAAGPSAYAAKTPFVATVAGPSDLAGAGCNRFFFTMGYQSDNPHEMMGKYLTAQNRKNVYVVVPNFPAGKDAVAGLKRFYKQPLVGEVFTPMNQIDFSTEIADIQSKKPELVYVFMPGGLGINFIKQYKLAGLSKISPLMGPNASFEEDILRGVSDSALGALNTSNWANDTPTQENKDFVAAFDAEYKRLPSMYAAYAYDMMLMLNTAVREVKGNINDREALTKAIESVKFKSIRGNFRFNTNHMPVQDWIIRAVVRDNQGRVTNKTVDRVAQAHVDAYVQNCPMGKK
jgi:branched-chain amino acid transport system substrate-binding protein